MSVAFYISGHGFGHAVRQIEIINTLSGLDPATSIVVRTSAPRWLFERRLQAVADDGEDPRALTTVTIIEGETDTGVVQRDSVTLDEGETIRRAAAFYEDLEPRAREEAALLRRHGVILVVTDAPPLACTAAWLAGVPSVICANFTWDWIYAGYAERLSMAPRLLSLIRDAYARASAGWRMPMHGGFETVPSIVDVPFVARQPRADRSRSEIRVALGLPLGIPLALVSFGGYGLEGLELDRLDCTPPWRVVMTGVSGKQPAAVIALDDFRIYGSGLAYQDVVRAVDVVVTKPGYGIISGCVANGTAMLYTSRGRFAEYDVMVAEMPQHLRCRFIEGDALRGGRWREALDALMATPPPVETPRVDGAHVVAEMIRNARRT